jgi:hypothetical protein
MRNRDRKDRYADAYWSRTGRYRSYADLAVRSLQLKPRRPKFRKIWNWDVAIKDEDLASRVNWPQHP